MNDAKNDQQAQLNAELETKIRARRTLRKLFILGSIIALGVFAYTSSMKLVEKASVTSVRPNVPPGLYVLTKPANQTISAQPSWFHESCGQYLPEAIVPTQSSKEQPVSESTVDTILVNRVRGHLKPPAAFRRSRFPTLVYQDTSTQGILVNRHSVIIDGTNECLNGHITGIKLWKEIDLGGGLDTLRYNYLTLWLRSTTDSLSHMSAGYDLCGFDRKHGKTFKNRGESFRYDMKFIEALLVIIRDKTGKDQFIVKWPCVEEKELGGVPNSYMHIRIPDRFDPIELGLELVLFQNSLECRLSPSTGKIQYYPKGHEREGNCIPSWRGNGVDGRTVAVYVEMRTAQL